MLLNACSDSKKMKAIEDFMNQTQNIRLNELVYFNEENIEESDFFHIIYPPVISIQNFSGIFIGKRYSEVEFNKKINDVQNKFQSVDVTGDCVKAVNKEKLLLDSCKAILMPNLANKLLIPDDLHSASADYYIVKYEKGYFLGEGFRHYFNHSSNLIHGYYSGITIFKKERQIIYWLIVL